MRKHGGRQTLPSRIHPTAFLSSGLSRPPSFLRPITRHFTVCPLQGFPTPHLISTGENEGSGLETKGNEKEVGSRGKTLSRGLQDAGAHTSHSGLRLLSKALQPGPARPAAACAVGAPQARRSQAAAGPVLPAPGVSCRPAGATCTQGADTGVCGQMPDSRRGGSRLGGEGAADGETPAEAHLENLCSPGSPSAQRQAASRPLGPV